MGLFVDRHSVRGTMCLNPSPLWCFSLNAFLVEKTAWVLRKRDGWEHGLWHHEYTGQWPG